MTRASEVLAEAGAEAARAAKIVESMSGFAWSANPSGRFTYVSPNTLTYLGNARGYLDALRDEDEFGWGRVVHPDDYDRVDAKWRHCLRTGDHYDTEHRLRRADGAYRWFRTSGRSSRDSQGRITQWYGTTVDIQEQKQAEAALRDRERELLHLVDMVPSHLWRLTPNGEPIFFNKRMVDFLGLDVSDTDRPGKSRLEVVIETVIHPDDASAFRGVISRCLVMGESFSMRYRLRRVDGVYRWMSSRAEPMRDQDGCIVQWYGLCHDIDDQVHAEEALRRSERQLQQLVDTVPALIWCTTPEGIPCYLNKRVTEVTGITLKDVIAPDGSRSLTVIHPDDRDAIDQALARSVKTGTPFVGRYRQRRSNGPHRWVESRAEPLRDDSGEILQWYGVSVDIHDLVTAQEALRDRERELSQLVDMVPIPIWRLTPDGRPTFFNKRLIDYFGLDVGDYEKPDMSQLAAAIQTLVHPDDAAGVAEALHRSFVTGEPYTRKNRLRRADGVYRWMEARGEPMRDQDGRILQWYGLLHDIEDQLHAEEALRRSERQLQEMIDAVPIRIWSASPAGGPVYFNKRYQDYLRAVVTNVEALKEQRIEQLVQELIHPEDAPDVMHALGNCFETGSASVLRFRWREKDGDYRWAECRLEPRRDQHGSIVQWYGASIDIDDEIRAQAALRQASDKLAQASQAASLAELSASIAHEVNQPLAAIVANSHACYRWLSVEPANLERAKTTAEYIIRDANSAADVVSRIRALFKQSVEPRSSTTLPNVITEVRNLMADEATRRAVRMDVDFESNLPPVAFDRVQIQQVLINLIRNGMDAMDSTAGDKLLVMRGRQIGDAIQTEISDRGSGVRFPDKIFDPFFTTKENGMGMGLAICRSIVESHGGRLWVENNEPGATFIFTLPIEVEATSR